jgi:hypothetical protein
MGKREGKMKIVAAIGLLLITTATFGQESIVKRRQDDWMKCLKASYKIQASQTKDKNLAAERALQACTTEEEALRTESGPLVPASSFASLKSAMKQVIVEGK